MELESADYQAEKKAEADRAKVVATVEKTRKSDLKTLKDAGSITSEVYSYAYANGLTAKEAINRQEIVEKVKSKTIVDYALENNISKDKAISLDEHGFEANRIRNQNGSVNAARYLQDKLNSGALLDYEVQLIAGIVGVTEEDFEDAVASSLIQPKTKQRLPQKPVRSGEF